MSVIYARNNNVAGNKITFSVLKKDKTKEIIVAFSGTQSTNQLINEITHSFPVKYSIHSQFTHALVADYFYKHYTNDFRTNLKGVLTVQLKAHPDYNLVFVGHSLGGALTVQAAADTVLSGWNAGKICYTLYLLILTSCFPILKANLVNMSKILTLI